MPIDNFTKEVLLLLAKNRNPDSYIAGATVLHKSEDSARYSQDIDVFHDNAEAVSLSFLKDKKTLEDSGYKVETTKELKTFIRAIVEKNKSAVRLEWAVDSAYRFFPVEKNAELGYQLNIWDIATNKILAASSRQEVRDYVDLIEIHLKQISLGALIWAAAGKDAGLTPHFIVDELKRIHHHRTESFSSLNLAKTLDPISLKKTWSSALDEALILFDLLAKAPLGCFFLDSKGYPRTPSKDRLQSLKIHKGSIKGTWPTVI